MVAIATFQFLQCAPRNLKLSINDPARAKSVKVYGRSIDKPDTLLTLQEVSFLMGPEQLRSLANFFLAQAASQEFGLGRDHAHYLDSAGAIQGGVEVVVADPNVIQSSR